MRRSPLRELPARSAPAKAPHRIRKPWPKSVHASIDLLLQSGTGLRGRALRATRLTSLCEERRRELPSRPYSSDDLRQPLGDLGGAVRARLRILPQHRRDERAELRVDAFELRGELRHLLV